MFNNDNDTAVSTITTLLSKIESIWYLGLYVMGVIRS